MLITWLLFILGAIYILLCFNALRYQKWPEGFWVFFSFTLLVFVDAFAYRHLLIQQRIKGEKQVYQLTFFRVLGVLFLVLGFLYVFLYVFGYTVSLS